MPNRHTNAVKIADFLIVLMHPLKAELWFQHPCKNSARATVPKFSSPRADGNPRDANHNRQRLPSARNRSLSASEAGLPIAIVNSEGNYSEAPGLPAVRVEETDLNLCGRSVAEKGAFTR
jgi:hypothetical protein